MPCEPLKKVFHAGANPVTAKGPNYRLQELLQEAILLDMEISRAISAVQLFTRRDLTATLAEIEGSLRGATATTCATALNEFCATNEALSGAATIKGLVGQIHVVIHALGILLCLPHLLEDNEVVEYVSLGAGNTGRAFDLETDRRIAEFKFIRWQGGPEPIRQNGLFKDFYLLAEHSSEKRKCLYLLGTKRPLKFLRGARSLSSVLNGHADIRERFFSQYGEQYRVVSEYYSPRQELVTLEDVSRYLPELTSLDLGATEG